MKDIKIIDYAILERSHWMSIDQPHSQIPWSKVIKSMFVSAILGLMVQGCDTEEMISNQGKCTPTWSAEHYLQ